MKNFAKYALLASAFLLAPSAFAQQVLTQAQAVIGQGVEEQTGANPQSRQLSRRDAKAPTILRGSKPQGNPARMRYDQHRPASEGLAAVARNGQWGFVDRKGQEVIAPQFEAVWEFREGMAAVKKNGRWGFIDGSGRIVIAPQYDNALTFGEGRAPVQKNGRWGFIDASGREVITPRYDKVWPFERGQAVVVNNGQHRRIDRNGQDVQPSASRKK
ncbi:MAG: WG repeat-containing protein [Cardiobacteriaceae bacterium]|nr:WG repeat-containing protein [Cardiobacteriaceae bacterium]